MYLWFYDHPCICTSRMKRSIQLCVSSFKCHIKWAESVVDRGDRIVSLRIVMFHLIAGVLCFITIFSLIMIESPNYDKFHPRHHKTRKREKSTLFYQSIGVVNNRVVSFNDIWNLKPNVAF